MYLDGISRNDDPLKIYNRIEREGPTPFGTDAVSVKDLQ